MKIFSIIAFLNLSFDCSFKAIGQNPQTLFPDQLIWLWWLAAVGWLLLALRMAYKYKVEEYD